MPKSKKKYYAYMVPGGVAGITDDWKKCEAVVSGKTDAHYRGFPAQAEAEKWLAEGARYEIKPPRPVKKLEPGIYFDAGTGRGNGVEISVTDEKGKNLLHKALLEKELNRFGKHRVESDAATNNYGELLALYYACAIAKKEKVKHIFGDSKLVIDYWSRAHMKKKELPEATVELIYKTVTAREIFEKNGGIIGRVSGDHNPADLGFHRK